MPRRIKIVIMAAIPLIPASKEKNRLVNQRKMSHKAFSLVDSDFIYCSRYLGKQNLLRTIIK